MPRGGPDQVVILDECGHGGPPCFRAAPRGVMMAGERLVSGDAERGAGSTVQRKTALVVLLGITATDVKCAGLRDVVSRSFDADLYIPDLPFRRGLDHCANWLSRYLAAEAVFETHETTHVLAYIAGGFVLRLMAEDLPTGAVGRVVWVRGPVQELVPAAVVRRYSWPLVRLSQGRTVTDLAGRRAADIPFPHIGRENGLIIEGGVSCLARDLRLSVDTVPHDGWMPGTLCPEAADVLKVPESHDDVYTSGTVLGAAIRFFRTGRFADDEGAS
jgi:hypothetical protein